MSSTKSPHFYFIFFLGGGAQYAISNWVEFRCFTQIQYTIHNIYILIKLLMHILKTFDYLSKWAYHIPTIPVLDTAAFICYFALSYVFFFLLMK